MLQSMTDSQNKHLKAWARAVKSIGKGTGKNAARYRADRRQMHMQKMHCTDSCLDHASNEVYDNFEIAEIISTSSSLMKRANHGMMHFF